MNLGGTRDALLGDELYPSTPDIIFDNRHPGTRSTLQKCMQGDIISLFPYYRQRTSIDAGQAHIQEPTDLAQGGDR